MRLRWPNLLISSTVCSSTSQTPQTLSMVLYRCLLQVLSREFLEVEMLTQCKNSLEELQILGQCDAVQPLLQRGHAQLFVLLLCLEWHLRQKFRLWQCPYESQQLCCIPFWYVQQRNVWLLEHITLGKGSSWHISAKVIHFSCLPQICNYRSRSQKVCAPDVTSPRCAALRPILDAPAALPDLRNPAQYHGWV